MASTAFAAVVWMNDYWRANATLGVGLVLGLIAVPMYLSGLLRDLTRATDEARRANEAGVELEELAITPAQVAAVQTLVDEGKINDKLARQVIEGVIAGEGEPAEVVAARGLAVVSDEGALGAAVDDVIAANPDVAAKIRDGKVAAAGALIGQVMKAMRGQADAGKVRELILAKLS